MRYFPRIVGGTSLCSRVPLRFGWHRSSVLNLAIPQNSPLCSQPQAAARVRVFSDAADSSGHKVSGFESLPSVDCSKKNHRVFFQDFSNGLLNHFKKVIAISAPTGSV